MTGISSMLADARSFNSDLSAWDVSCVRDMSGMLADTRSFNSDLSAWNVSGAGDMACMFNNARSFSQNLSIWYIILDDTFIDIGSGAKKIEDITAQNPVLNGQNPVYGIGSGADFALFAIDGNALKIKPSADYCGKTGYAVKITSPGDFGTNNFQVINVTVAGGGGGRHAVYVGICRITTGGSRPYLERMSGRLQFSDCSGMFSLLAGMCAYEPVVLRCLGHVVKAF